MKRLLLICGTALLLAPAAFAAKPQPSLPGTLALTSCASPCLMAATSADTVGLDVWFSGTGYSPRADYAFCLNGPSSFCGGLYGKVDASGTLSFGLGLVQPGDWTVQVFKQSGKGLTSVSPEVAFTLITS